MVSGTVIIAGWIALTFGDGRRLGGAGGIITISPIAQRAMTLVLEFPPFLPTDLDEPPGAVPKCARP